MAKPSETKPLVPPATEAELDRASEIWTAAMDDMVSRGFERKLWGYQSEATKDFTVLLLRNANQTT